MFVCMYAYVPMYVGTYVYMYVQCMYVFINAYICIWTKIPKQIQLDFSRPKNKRFILSHCAHI